MARETQRRKAQRTEVDMRQDAGPKIEEQRRFFSSHGNDGAVRTARALEAAFGVATDTYAGHLDRANAAGRERAVEQAGAGGSRDVNDKNAAYHRAWDLLDDERSLQFAKKELPKLLLEADAENLKEPERQALITKFMEDQFAGTDLKNEDHTFLATGLLQLETETLVAYRDLDLAKIKEGQRSDTYAAELENYAETGAVRYDVLMDRTNIFLDGTEKKLAYREMIYDLAIENGDPSIILNEPEKFPDGSQTGKNDPLERDNRRAAIQAATVRQAAMEKERQDAEVAKNDQLRFDTQMLIYRQRLAGHDVTPLIEQLAAIPGTELSDISAAKNFGDSQLDEKDSRSADLPLTTQLWHDVYASKAGPADVMFAHSNGLLGSGPQAKDEAQRMMAAVESMRKSGESLQSTDDTQWRSVLNKRYNPQLGGLLAKINPVMNRINIDANAMYIDMRAQGLSPRDAANKVFEEFDAVAEKAPALDDKELEAGVRSQGDFTSSSRVTTDRIKAVADGKLPAREAFAGVPDYVVSDRLLQEIDNKTITQEQAKEIYLSLQ